MVDIGDSEVRQHLHRLALVGGQLEGRSASLNGTECEITGRTSITRRLSRSTAWANSGCKQKVPRRSSSAVLVVVQIRPADTAAGDPHAQLAGGGAGRFILRFDPQIFGGVGYR